MFKSVIGSELTLPIFIVCILTAFVLGLIVAFTHIKTSRTSSHFAITLALLPVLVTMAIMLVNGNLGAGVATMGVFSLIRFRSIAGNSRSLLGVFFAMAIGLACGMGYLGFAAIFTVIVAGLTFALTAMKFGQTQMGQQKLTILVPEDLDYTEIFDDIFDGYTREHRLEKVKTTNMGSLYELKYLVKLKPDAKEKEFIDKLRVKNGNLKVCLNHALEDEEL